MSAGRVILWYLHDGLEAERFENVDSAVSVAAYRENQGGGVADSIETPERIIRGDELQALLTAKASAQTVAQLAYQRKHPVVGVLRVRHHTENRWTAAERYTDAAIARRDIERLTALVGADRVEWEPTDA